MTEQPLYEPQNLLKIAVAAKGPGLDALVGRRFGAAEYLVIVYPETMEVEAVPNPGAPGIQLVAFAISKKVQTVFTGYCSPIAQKYLEANGIEVVTGMAGTVREVVGIYKSGVFSRKKEAHEKKPESRVMMINRKDAAHGLIRSARQFGSLMPVMIGVTLLIGLFNAMVSREGLTFLFSGNRVLDALWGTCIGSVLAGNPLNSYIIGGKLLEYGVSLLGVTAFMVAWVSVGLVQLPAEITALGWRFALSRNSLSMFSTMVIANLTVLSLNTILVFIG